MTTTHDTTPAGEAWVAEVQHTLRGRIDAASNGLDSNAPPGVAEAVAVLRETLDRLDTEPDLWVAEPDRVTPPVAPHITRFVGGTMLDAMDDLSADAFDHLQYLHGDYTDLICQGAPRLMHHAPAPSAHAARDAVPAWLAIDAPSELPQDSVNMALLRSERAYRMVANRMRTADGELPEKRSERIVIAALGAHADTLRALRDGAASAHDDTYTEPRKIEATVVGTIEAIVSAADDFPSRQRAHALLRFMLGEQDEEPTLGASDADALGLLTSAALLIADDYRTGDPDFIGGFALATRLAVYFGSLAVAAEDAVPGTTLNPEFMRLAVPDMISVILGGAAGMLDRSERLETYAVFHAVSCLIADAVSAGADTVQAPDDRAALLYAARAIEQRGAELVPFAHETAVVS